MTTSDVQDIQPTTLYKLTDEDMLTYGGCEWRIGATKEVSGEGPLCSDGWLHAYEHPLLAILHNPIHAQIRRARLFEARGEGFLLREGFMKCGVTKLTLVREMDIPQIPDAAYFHYAYRCSLQIQGYADWKLWAQDWLDGKRSVSMPRVVPSFLRDVRQFCVYYPEVHLDIHAKCVLAQAVETCAHRCYKNPLVLPDIAEMAVKMERERRRDDYR